MVLGHCYLALTDKSPKTMKIAIKYCANLSPSLFSIYHRADCPSPVTYSYLQFIAVSSDKSKHRFLFFCREGIWLVIYGTESVVPRKLLHLRSLVNTGFRRGHCGQNTVGST